MKIAYVFADHLPEAAAILGRRRAFVSAINNNSRHTAALIAASDFARGLPGAHTLCAQADLIVVQGAFFPDLLRMMQRWRAQDKVLVADLDDAYHLFPIGGDLQNGNLAAPVGIGGESLPSAILYQRCGLQLAHAALACSSLLADDCSDLTKAYYLPEYINLSDYEMVAARDHDGVVLGWRGSRAQAQGFWDSGLGEALGCVCASFPNVSILILEPQPFVFAHLRVPDRQKLFYPSTCTAFDAQFFAEIDIALAPACGPYDQRRGRLALLEYMSAKIPWLASEAPANYKLRNYGRLVKNGVQDWLKAIQQMVETIEDQRAYALGSPYIYALSQGVDANIDKVLAVYEEIYIRAVSV